MAASPRPVTVLSCRADIVRQAGILHLYKPLLRRVLRSVDAIVIGSPPMRGARSWASIRPS